MVAAYLFLIWSRGHWLCCLLPAVLLLEYYWSASLGLLPPNHSPYRSAGLTIAVVGLMVLRRASARTNQWAAGIVSGLAVLANIESGIAATAGLVVYLYRRYALVGPNGRRGVCSEWLFVSSAGLLAVSDRLCRSLSHRLRNMALSTGAQAALGLCSICHPQGTARDHFASSFMRMHVLPSGR